MNYEWAGYSTDCLETVFLRGFQRKNPSRTAADVRSDVRQVMSGICSNHCFISHRYL